MTGADAVGDLELSDYESGKAATEHFLADRPEFIVCDVHMPEHDGLATLQMIRDLCGKKGLPLPKMVLVSARLTLRRWPVQRKMGLLILCLNRPRRLPLMISVPAFWP